MVIRDRLKRARVFDDLARSFCVELRIVVVFAKPMRGLGLPALLHHVSRIIFAASYEQMAWIAAWRIIAAMQNVLVGIQFSAIGKRIGNAVSLEVYSSTCC